MIAVRSCKINIFKHAARLLVLFPVDAQAAIRLDAAIRGNGHDLSWLHVPDEFCAHAYPGRMSRTAMNIRIVPLADAKGLESKGIPHAHELSGVT